MDNVITRFAPSPTGHLHLGHVYAAWVAWSEARRAGGRCLLRIEDIDTARSRPEFEAVLHDDMTWLGLAFDGAAVRQSDRFPLYETALKRLRDAGLVYPCFCTRKDIALEIERAGGAPQGPDGPIYPGVCRGMEQMEAERLRRAGAPHAWRLRADHAIRRAGPLIWVDALKGEQTARPELFGDVVLARKDTPVSYHLAVTVDDADQGVTLATRGEDLFETTHIHRLLQALLRLPAPRYHHHELLTDETGKRLAKRDAARSIQELRAAGHGPKDVWRMAGVADGDQP